MLLSKQIFIRKAGTVIFSREGIVTEDLVFDMNKTVSADGGYNCGFTGNAGNLTSITGSITIAGGSVTLSNFLLEK